MKICHDMFFNENSNHHIPHHNLMCWWVFSFKLPTYTHKIACWPKKQQVSQFHIFKISDFNEHTQMCKPHIFFQTDFRIIWPDFHCGVPQQRIVAANTISYIIYRDKSSSRTFRRVIYYTLYRMYPQPKS